MPFAGIIGCLERVPFKRLCPEARDVNKASDIPATVAYYEEQAMADFPELLIRAWAKWDKSVIWTQAEQEGNGIVLKGGGRVSTVPRINAMSPEETIRLRNVIVDHGF